MSDSTAHNPNASVSKRSLLILFLAVFIDLIGFGIVLPLLPKYGRLFGASGLTCGVLMASYSIMQFIFTPIWGRLSDRIGRRPMLLSNTVGAAISYGVFALGSRVGGNTGLMILLGSRAFAGVFGSNITIAQAYIADITPVGERSKRMGLIGMAFGLGFIFGPALGALAFSLFGMSGPGWLAACFCTANFILAFSILPESWKPSSEHAALRPRFAQWKQTLQHPKIGVLIGVFFLATLCFTCFETTLTWLGERNFRINGEKVGYLFAYCGVIGAIVQGGSVGRLVRRLGEPGLIAWSLVLVSISLAILPFLTTITSLLIALALLAIGSSLTRPPVFGMISILTSAREQGATLGVAQSAGSLARIFGPPLAGALYDLQPTVPYLLGAGLSLVAGIVAWQLLGRESSSVPQIKTQEAG